MTTSSEGPRCGKGRESRTAFNGAQLRWTALEVFTALAPHRVSRLTDLATAFEAETRRAHCIAIEEGYDWNPEGRYPLDVWMQVGC